MRRAMRISLVTVLALGLLAGCSKKTTQAPPAPPSPVPVAKEPPPPPPPPQAPPAEPTHVELGDVFFDYDSAELREDARNTLTQDGRMLVENSAETLTIEGHCDERGSVDYNLALGERRASAAKDFLESYGVAGDRMKTISYGENRPFALGHDEAAWAQNRRAHFIVNP